MKRRLFFLVFILSFGISAQISESSQNYLVTYGQVWGFLKYFHPEPSNRDWDQVLIDDFDALTNCKSDVEFNNIIAQLITICSNYTPIKREIPDSLLMEKSFEWMRNNLISVENGHFLVNLKLNKPKFENKYIRSAFNGNPKITNEGKFEHDSIIPAISYLALTRYWNIINYYFPYREIIPSDWNFVYGVYLPDFIAADSYSAYHVALKKLAAQIRDGHAETYSDSRYLIQHKRPPFECVNVEDGMYIKWVKYDSSATSTLQPMDKLISIDGQTVHERFDEIRTRTSVSNDYFLSKLTYYFLSTTLDSVLVTVERNGELITEKVKTISYRELYEDQPKPTTFVRPYSIRTDSISGLKYAYVDMGKLRRKDISSKFWRKINRVDHLIIDSRNYPHMTLDKLSKRLVSGQKTLAKLTKIDFDYPGSFNWFTSEVSGSERKHYEGNVYILVDYQTMSQAEFTVMGLQQNPTTVVIGGQTAGADGDVSTIVLPFGVGAVFSGLGVFYPDGTPTQQVGIKRDYAVVQDSSFVLDQVDAIFNKALELIRTK